MNSTLFKIVPGVLRSGFGVPNFCNGTYISHRKIHGKFKFVKRVPGNMYTGKHRLVPPVNMGDRMQIWYEMMEEEENMLYLRHPYLTEEEQQFGLAEDLKKMEKSLEKSKEKWVDPNENFLPDRQVLDHIEYLSKQRTFE